MRGEFAIVLFAVRRAILDALGCAKPCVRSQVSDALRYNPGTGTISVDLPRGMDSERLAERTFFVLMQMRKSLPRFVKYM